MNQSHHSSRTQEQSLTTIREARRSLQDVADAAERADKFLDCLEQVLEQDTDLTPNDLNRNTFADLPSRCNDMSVEAQAAEYLIKRIQENVEWTPPEEPTD